MSRRTKVKKWQVVLRLGRLSTPQVIANAKHYVESMTGNIHFPYPTPGLATITSQISTLEDAYILSLTRAVGTVVAMHTERDSLSRMLTHLAAYVELVANADPLNASSIISAAGMIEKKHMTRAPKVFSATNGNVKGDVILDSKAVSGGVYIYQISTNPSSPKSWETISTSNTVRHLFTGLTSATTYFFRVAVIRKGIQEDWGPVAELIVL
jgi:hypothetical protein